MKERLAYIDRLKGLAIYLVVLGHILQHYFDDSALAVRIIYSFHIPLFMFMSGYVCYKKSEWDLVSKRAVQLLVPFFSYIGIKYLFDLVIYPSHMDFITWFKDIILHPDRGLWFLWALFFINVIFIASRKTAKRIRVPEWIVFVVVAGVLNGIVIFAKFRLFGFHWIAWYFIYFVAGAYWRMWDSKRKESLKGYPTLLALSLVLFPIMVYFFRMHNEPPSFYQWINFGSLFPVFYRFAIGMVGIALCMAIFRLFAKRNIIYCILSNWGGYTLGIYYIHFFVIALLFLVPFDESSICLMSTVSGIYSLLATYLSYALAKASLLNPISAFLIDGESLSRS